METLRAGVARFRQKTEKVGDKVMRQALNSQVDIREKLHEAVHEVRDLMHMHGPRRQYSIAGREVQEERQLSEGGFAFVWLARDLRTDEQLVLKKISCQDEEKQAMCRREVEILERLPHHPNVVKYYGHTVRIEERSKEVILLFELCPGGHLLDLLERNKGVLSEECILSVFKDLVTAVGFLHDQEPPVQHRDLKVENVLLGAGGNFKLCDFGSWSTERSLPASLDRKGMSDLQENIDRYTTMMYRPPEMVDFYLRFSISEKVDIWMLGCILFTLMFYRHPFQDEGSLAIANARYTMPSQSGHSLKMQDLCHWLLAKDPDNRPSAKQILQVIAHFDDDVPLPLPSSVIARREQQRRLYEDVRSNSASCSSSGRPQESPRHRPSRQRAVSASAACQEPATPASERRKKKDKSLSRATAGHGFDAPAGGDFWSMAMPADGGKAGSGWPPPAIGAPATRPPDPGWPAAAVAVGTQAAPSPWPETSRGWASFDNPARAEAARQGGGSSRSEAPWGGRSVPACPWGEQPSWSPSSGSRSRPLSAWEAASTESARRRCDSAEALWSSKSSARSCSTKGASRRGRMRVADSAAIPWGPAATWPHGPRALEDASPVAAQAARRDQGGGSFWESIVAAEAQAGTATSSRAITSAAGPPAAPSPPGPDGWPAAAPPWPTESPGLGAGAPPPPCASAASSVGGTWAPPPAAGGHLASGGMSSSSGTSSRPPQLFYEAWPGQPQVEQHHSQSPPLLTQQAVRAPTASPERRSVTPQGSRGRGTPPAEPWNPFAALAPATVPAAVASGRGSLGAQSEAEGCPWPAEPLSRTRSRTASNSPWDSPQSDLGGAAAGGFAERPVDPKGLTW